MESGQFTIWIDGWDKELLDHCRNANDFKLQILREDEIDYEAGFSSHYSNG